MKQVLDNPVKNQTNSFSSLVIITAILVTIYLTANIMAVKLINVFGITIFDAGTITFPFAYMLGDVLTEVWGFKTAKKVIWLTFFCNILMVGFTTLGVFLPTPEYNGEMAEAYSMIFSAVPRILIASLVGFLTGELSNAWIMEKIKKLTKGKHLWMRTIGSSMVGYILDTTFFVLIAFAGTVPVEELISMIVIQYFGKLIIEAVAGTPLAYGLIGILQKKLNTE